MAIKTRIYKLADRMASIDGSPFLAVLRAAKEVEAQGKTVRYLSMGEPDFKTPDHIRQAGIAAIQRGDTGYTAMDGTPQLKSAIAIKMKRDNGLDFAADQITVTLGGTQALFNGMFATTGPGDEVILPAPYFQPYISAIKLAGATPVIVPTREERGFVLTAEDLIPAISDKTRWLILNSPSNPAGTVIEACELVRLAEVLRGHPDIMIWTDDIYESIVFDGRKFENIINLAPDLKDRTVILNGVSKAYAMTGWRVGYLCGPAPVIEAISQVCATQTFAPCSITQAAAAEALTSSQDIVHQRRDAYEARRNLVCDRLRLIPGITIADPKGAFYAFPSCHSFFGKCTPEGNVIETDLDFVLYVLRSQGLATVQGSAFGLPGYFRISFAADEEVLADALDLLRAACANLS
jgi:aspartate aminotransferase